MREVYAFRYAVRPGEWRMLKDSVDTTFLNTRYPQGFVGCMYALFATSVGKPSNTVAYFDWSEYVGDDEVYKLLLETINFIEVEYDAER